jgi:hypothetical protein
MTRKKETIDPYEEVVTKRLVLVESLVLIGFKLVSEKID